MENNSHRGILAAVCAAVVLALPAAGGDMLFKDGKSDWRISIRPEATAAEVFAADELQTNILKISGARLPVVREGASSAPKAIVIAPSLPAGPNDTVAIRTDGGCLLLEANSPRATLYSVYRFLQDWLGARWYWPEEDGEYLPRLDRYELPAIDWRFTPRFRYREMSQTGIHGHIPTELWMVKMGLNTGRQSKSPLTAPLYIRRVGSHNIKVGGDEDFAKHPEWFSLVDGRRVKDGRAGCWSNPEFTAAMVERLKDMVRENDAEILCAFPADTTLRCQCAECTKNPDPSSRWFNYYASLVREVRKEFPDLLAAGIAYQDYRKPPVDPIRELAYVDYCQYNRCYFHRLGDPACPVNGASMELLGEWLGRSPMGVYGYHFDIFRVKHFLPIWNILADEARTYADLGLIRFKTEMSVRRPKDAPREDLSHIKFRIPYYIYARLAWDPSLKPDDILRDWCEHVYGAGAKPMFEYLTRFAADWDAMKAHVSYFFNSADGIAQQLLTPESIAYASGRIDAAEAAAKAAGGGADAERALREIRIERALFRQWERTWEIASTNHVSFVIPHHPEGTPFSGIRAEKALPVPLRAGKLEHQPTEMRLYWSDEALHIQVTAHDADIANLRQGATGHDISFSSGDSIEIFIGIGDGLYRQLAITPAGGTYDARMQDVSWNGDWKAETKIESDRWIAEITIPFASLVGARPSDGDTWRLSVIRNDFGHGACGFPLPVYRDLGLMASVVFSEKSKGQRLVWLGTPFNESRRWRTMKNELAAHGWEAKGFIGAEAEKAAREDFDGADLIFVETYKNELSESLYREKIVPAVRNGAVLFLCCYFWCGDLDAKFDDPTYKVEFKTGIAKPHVPTWFTDTSFATTPNRIKVKSTPSGVFFPAFPDKWEPLAKQRRVTGEDAPYMMVRPCGTGAVLLTAALRGELADCIDNIWAYNGALRHDAGDNP